MKDGLMVSWLWFGGIARVSVAGASRHLVALAVFCALVAASFQTAAAQTLSVLHTFTGSPDGAGPYVGVVQDASGNLYGATYYGGGFGAGVVFEITPDGTEKVLYTFTGLTDGGGPNGDLLLDSQGNLYGTTYFGGTLKNGTVFELTSTGTEKVLYNFTGGADGALPIGSMLRDAHGNFHGTAEYGGSTNNGAVFELTPSGVEKTVYSFTGGSDGGTPLSGLIKDAKGNFYGTTYYGGAAGGGAVFKVTPGGVEKVLYSFKGFKDATSPQSGVVLDSTGDLYGTTITGGALGGGAVYEIFPGGREKILHSFGSVADAFFPAASLVRDGEGNLFGTSLFGGATGQGAVFEITASGTEKVLYSFTGGADGANPRSRLILDAQGKLYGTTSAGGAQGLGTVFKITP